MFSSIPIYSLRYTESVQYFNDVLSLCSNHDPQALKITAEVAALETSVNRLNEGSRPEMADGLTSELVELDTRRDRAIVCLRMMAEAYTNHYLPEKRQAGASLLNTIDKFGGPVSRLNYQAETSTLTSLGSELQTNATLVAQVEELGLSGLVDELVESNVAFNARYIDRVEADAADNGVAMKQLILDAMKAYRVLLSHITAHATLTPGETYSKLIDQINELIDKYLHLIASRKRENEDPVV